MGPRDNSGQDLPIYGGDTEDRPKSLEDWTRQDAARWMTLPPLRAIVLLALHGNLCLALRHPANIGPSRRLVIEMVHELERVLGAAGLTTVADIEKVRRDCPETRMCRVCGCIDTEACADPDRGGEPCHWIGLDLCSACAGN